MIYVALRQSACENHDINLVGQFIMSPEALRENTNGWTSMKNEFNCSCQHIWMEPSDGVPMEFELLDSELKPIDPADPLNRETRLPALSVSPAPQAYLFVRPTMRLSRTPVECLRQWLFPRAGAS